MPVPSTLMIEQMWKQYLSHPSLQLSILKKFKFVARFPLSTKVTQELPKKQGRHLEEELTTRGSNLVFSPRASHPPCESDPYSYSCWVGFVLSVEV